MHRLRVERGDITTFRVDAIVNAANETMLGGGGVDGAIHRAAGPELIEACLRIPEIRRGVRCPTGEARITPAFRLPARFVIHTVGPVWVGGGAGEPDLLASCYRNLFALAREHACRTLAVPAISCGVYRYPLEEAAGIAVRESLSALAGWEEAEAIVLVAFEAEVERALAGASAAAGGRREAP